MDTTFRVGHIKCVSIVEIVTWRQEGSKDCIHIAVERQAKSVAETLEIAAVSV